MHVAYSQLVFLVAFPDGPVAERYSVLGVLLVAVLPAVPAAHIIIVSRGVVRVIEVIIGLVFLVRHFVLARRLPHFAFLVLDEAGVINGFFGFISRIRVAIIILQEIIIVIFLQKIDVFYVDVPRGVVVIFAEGDLVFFGEKFDALRAFIRAGVGHIFDAVIEVQLNGLLEEGVLAFFVSVFLAGEV